ncbi:unnamed protein product [Nesidiocoris tenuis]|uniref:NADH dehydrogenase [ubiquinone] 1 alpha subcomplex subunit 10, mitochondrial n=1 Tax=Nesidiocoris tenuis TaxID=355587 RepID=A0A6H5GZ72_9HEMI|nr:unnamed protein product [Nesidiocoris tenuis]CAB0008316.1 unnamed protein product [Nesidiocoris tenuis]
MLHMEDVNMDMYYINPGGYDMRQLDDQMPDDMKSFDETKFNLDPKHRNVAGFQAWMYRLRLSRYIDALAHVLSTGSQFRLNHTPRTFLLISNHNMNNPNFEKTITGQGIVIERTPWTDGVFTDAMCDHGYISKGARFTMNELKRCTLPMLMRPHLVIYLDVPVEQVQENIKKRNKFCEAKGKALTTGYLETLEDNYKTKYLPKISEHAELMIYDWGTPGDVEVVVEDIERLDLDQYGLYDTKMNDWYIPVEKYLAEKRMLYADDKEQILSYLNVPTLEAPEMWVGGEDHKQWFEVWTSAPGNKYEHGYDPESTPLSSLLFKTKKNKYMAY